VKPIGDLLGLRCAFTDSLRIQATAVPADDLDGRMAPKPLGRTLDAAVVQYIDNRAALEIYHDGSIARRPPPTPVIDADHPDLGAAAVSDRGIPLQLPQDGVVADGHAEPLHQALARSTARTVTKQADNFRDPCRPARILGSDHRKAVGERLSLTFLMSATPTAQQKLNRYGLSLDREILKAADGPAVPTSASPPAIGANADRGSGG